ncbi:hypothetical protein [Leuconostoc pseudomesenteroides]|uniref:hypothetical protein n=1 Tax=Leuconostoc pseudomesenteroides TaxID=33968 RepID=UPI0039E9F90C
MTSVFGDTGIVSLLWLFVVLGVTCLIGIVLAIVMEIKLLLVIKNEKNILIDFLLDPRLGAQDENKILQIMLPSKLQRILLFEKGALFKIMSETDMSIDKDNDVVVLNSRSILRSFLMDILLCLKLFSIGFCLCLMSMIPLALSSQFRSLTLVVFVPILLIIFVAYYFIRNDMNLFMAYRKILLMQDETELLQNFDYQNNYCYWSDYMTTRKQLVAEKFEVMKQLNNGEVDKLAYDYFSQDKFLKRLSGNRTFVNDVDILSDNQLVKQAIKADIENLKRYPELESITEQLSKKYVVDFDLQIQTNNKEI